MGEKVYALIYTYSGDIVLTDCSIYSKKEDAEKAFNEQRNELLSSHGYLKAINYKHSLVLYTEYDEDKAIESPIDCYEYIELTIEEQNIL